MPATVVIVETNGASPGTLHVSPANLNMGSADATALDTSTYPITAQDGGCSYEKWIRLKVTAMGGSNSVDNVEVWLSDLGTGYASGERMLCNLVTSGYSPASYPAGGPSNTTSTVALNQMPLSQPNGPNMGIGGILSGVITLSDVPAYSDYIVLQEQVTKLTPAGSTSTKTLTVQWDEL